jgi:hypothetical protein
VSKAATHSEAEPKDRKCNSENEGHCFELLMLIDLWFSEEKQS